MIIIVGYSSLIQFDSKSRNTSSILPTPSVRSTPAQWVESDSEREARVKDREKYNYILDNKLVFVTPSGWIQTDCGGSLNIDPSYSGGCATEPNAWAINVYVRGGSIQDELAKDNYYVKTNINNNLKFSGHKAIQFDEEIQEGQGQGIYKVTLIQYDDDTSVSYTHLTLPTILRV